MDLKNKLFKGDCLEVMKKFPDKSFDMILCDLPYGSTDSTWDVVIPFKPLWEEYKRLMKDDCQIILFGSEPFSSYMRMSNIEMYKYDWIWDKVKPGTFSTCKYQPLKQHEIISVFYDKVKYFPQMVKRDKPRKYSDRYDNNIHLSKHDGEERVLEFKYPKTIITESNANQVGKLHRNQKPVPLYEYLIRTYTNEGDLILDNCAGSGTLGVSCLNTNRYFTMIEKEREYYDIIIDRIKKHKEKMNLERKDNE